MSRTFAKRTTSVSICSRPRMVGFQGLYSISSKDQACPRSLRPPRPSS
ncbi:hypothetical protein [Lysobacter gummosus]